jgi:hypothetical protein
MRPPVSLMAYYYSFRLYPLVIRVFNKLVLEKS